MRKIVIALAAAAAVLAAPAAQARDKQTGEQKLAKLLEGRKAGKPVDCIPLSISQESQVIDKTAIVYGHGDVIYVNRPTNAKDLNSNDVMVTKRSLSQLCKLDTIQMRDPSQYFFTGFVGLQEFVPYRRVKQKD